MIQSFLSHTLFFYYLIVTGICICNAGWRGQNCTTVIPCDPSDCAGRGVCMLGTCTCHEGWTGSGCTIEMPCPNDCSNRGQCFDGRCVCDLGYVVCLFVEIVCCVLLRLCVEIVCVEIETCFVCSLFFVDFG